MGNTGDGSLCSFRLTVFSLSGRAGALPGVGFCWKIGGFCRKSRQNQRFIGNTENRPLCSHVYDPTMAPIFAETYSFPAETAMSQPASQIISMVDAPLFMFLTIPDPTSQPTTKQLKPKANLLKGTQGTVLCVLFA